MSELDQLRVTIAQQAAEIETLRTEHLEQSRLLGMSGERECALLGKIDRKDVALRVAMDALDKIAWDRPPGRETSKRVERLEKLALETITTVTEALK